METRLKRPSAGESEGYIWTTGMIGFLSAWIVPAIACAEGAATPAIDTGDTAWVLTSSALVLMMTLPGLALFYGGLVRAKNILNVLMQCFLSAGVVGVLWILLGYSLAFGTGGAFIGDFSKVGLANVTLDSATANLASPPLTRCFWCPRARRRLGRVSLGHLRGDVRLRRREQYSAVYDPTQRRRLRRRVCAAHDLLHSHYPKARFGSLRVSEEEEGLDSRNIWRVPMRGALELARTPSSRSATPIRGRANRKSNSRSLRDEGACWPRPA